MESEDIRDKEIDSWKGFEYALREENRTLFNKMHKLSILSLGLNIMLIAHAVTHCSTNIHAIGLHEHCR